MSNKLKAILIKDRGGNPYMHCLPGERHEVRFANITEGDRSKVAPFSHRSYLAGFNHRDTVRKWCASNVAGYYSIGMESVFFNEADDAMLCWMNYA